MHALLMLALMTPGEDPKPTELKVIATGLWRAPVRDGKAQQLVLKDADALAAATDRARDDAGRKEAVQAMAKLFKVDAIDFDKQMIVVVTAGPKPTGGFAVTIDGVRAEGKTATVRWKLKTPAPGDFVTEAFTHPARAALVERFDGEVKFDPPLKKE
jgi:hypothetical protein